MQNQQSKYVQSQQCSLLASGDGPPPASAAPVGAPIFVGLPVIPDDAPTEVKNQIGIRNQWWIEGVCPSCDATPEVTPIWGSVVRVTFQHDLDCPVAELLDPRAVNTPQTQ